MVDGDEWVAGGWWWMVVPGPRAGGPYGVGTGGLMNLEAHSGSLQPLKDSVLLMSCSSGMKNGETDFSKPKR